ncbi:MAG TPA: hypothetical protein VJK66_04795 [Gaiellaceae bacterium]|nr:hypothetical protein [Gaiellaceae bacterium]
MRLLEPTSALAVGDDELGVEPARVADLDSVGFERLERGEVGDVEVGLLGDAVHQADSELSRPNARERLGEEPLHGERLDPGGRDVERPRGRAGERASFALDPVLGDISHRHAATAFIPPGVSDWKARSYERPVECSAARGTRCLWAV